MSGQAPIPSRRSIESALPGLIGAVEQRPPAYSAVHVNGTRAYRLARSGVEPNLPTRMVRIHEIRPISFTLPDATFIISCSAGTYIRSIAHDLGKLAGSCAHVTALARTRIGPFHIDEACTAEDLSADDYIRPFDFIRRIDKIEIRTVRPQFRSRILDGRPLDDSYFSEAPSCSRLCAVFDEEENLLAMVRRENSRFAYLGVFANHADRFAKTKSACA